MQWLGHPCLYNQNLETGTSPAVQWLRLCASNARDLAQIPGQGIKIPHAVWQGQVYVCIQF